MTIHQFKEYKKRLEGYKQTPNEHTDTTVALWDAGWNSCLKVVINDMDNLMHGVYVEELTQRNREDNIPYDNSVEPVWKTAQKLIKSLPDDAWDDMPTDGAKNYKHYLYGHPKCEEDES